MAQPDTDPFDQLRARIRATADAAERLSFEAAQGAPSGEAGSDRGRRARAADDATQEAQALVNLIGLLRDVVPDDLRQQVMDLVRQVLMLIRAVIDWYLARLEPATRDVSSRRPPVVEDIPLDEV